MCGYIRLPEPDLDSGSFINKNMVYNWIHKRTMDGDAQQGNAWAAALSCKHD